MRLVYPPLLTITAFGFLACSGIHLAACAGDALPGPLASTLHYGAFLIGIPAGVYIAAAAAQARRRCGGSPPDWPDGPFRRAPYAMRVAVLVICTYACVHLAAFDEKYNTLFQSSPLQPDASPAEVVRVFAAVWMAIFSVAGALLYGAMRRASPRR
ncbi:MAG TPA: hypothetical protein VGM37_07185 [Armatimonadota bacterium]|jgi:hypothetical protein